MTNHILITHEPNSRAWTIEHNGKRWAETGISRAIESGLKAAGDTPFHLTLDQEAVRSLLVVMLT